MKGKTIMLIVSIIISMSCNNKPSEQAQEVVQNQDSEQVKPAQNQEESNTNMSSEVVSSVDYDVAILYLKKGYQPFSKDYYQSDDFDNNGTRDFAIAVFKSNSKEYNDEPLNLHIYKQLKNRNFELAAESGAIEEILIVGHGSLSLQKNVISVKKGAMRYDNEWKFRYDKKHDDYVLIGSEYNSYGNAAGDGSGNRSINYLTGKRIDKFNEYDYEKEELIELEPKETKVPSVKTKPIFLKALNNDSCFDL